MTRTIIGFEIKVVGQAPAAARFAGFRPQADHLAVACCWAAASPASPALFEVAGPIGQLIPTQPGYGFTAIIVAFLGRLHPLGIIPAGLLMALSYIGGENAQVEVGLPQARDRRVPGHAAVLPARVRFPGPLPRRVHARAPGGRPSMNLEVAIPVVLTIISAATPLLLAGIGELVVERSGVLNLGVEGMMLAGAVTAFAVTFATGSYTAGILAAALAGMLLALIFGVLTLTLVSNQVATGLALTMFGLGLSALVGSGFVGSPVQPLPKLVIPGLSTIPGARAARCSARMSWSTCRSP